MTSMTIGQSLFSARASGGLEIQGGLQPFVLLYLDGFGDQIAEFGHAVDATDSELFEMYLGLQELMRRRGVLPRE